MSRLFCCRIFPSGHRKETKKLPLQNTNTPQPFTAIEQPPPGSPLSTGAPDRSTNAPLQFELGTHSPAYQTDNQPVEDHFSQNRNGFRSNDAPSTTTKSHAVKKLSSSCNLWEVAVGKLKDNEREWINKVQQGPRNASDTEIVDDIIRLVTEKRDQCEKKAWDKFHIGDYEIPFQDLASKSIVWLNKFKEIGDIIIQYDPGHAALPWAAARLVLQCAVAYDEQMASSLVIIERTTRVVHRCQVFERLYTDKLPLEDTKELKSTLVKLYTMLLQGLVILSDLKTYEEEVEKEVDVCQAQNMSQKLDVLLSLEKPLLRVDKNIAQILSRITAGDLITILTWISDVKYTLHHKFVSESRTIGTCDWMLRRSKFYEWQTMTSSTVLWLQGLPGTGKTYISSRVIDKVITTLSDEINHEGFAFFYCNRTEQERREAITILRSYIRQLSAPTNQPNHIFAEIQKLYTDSMMKGSGWTLTLCEEYILKLLNIYPRSTLILDALDECHVGERETILNMFDSLTQKSSKPVRIFISSRPEGDIRQRLSHLPRIEISAIDNENDIAQYVARSIQRNGRWSSALEKNPDLKDEIITTLLEKSQGMFQWAKLQIDQLLNLRHEKDIRERLGKLPTDLQSAYNEIYKNIEFLPSHGKDMAFRALKWVMCAYKPLTTNELLMAICIDPKQEVINKVPETTKEDILDWCANLLVIDSQHDKPVWRVSHLSVIEYLEGHWTLAAAHCFVATASLLLLIEISQSSKGGADDENDQLRQYVRYHWANHVQTQEYPGIDSKLVRLLKLFFGSPNESSQQYRNWHHQINNGRLCPPLTSMFSERGFIDQISPPNITTSGICRLGLYYSVQHWWENSQVDILQTNTQGDDLLTLAIISGCKPICEYLIRRGVDLNILCQTRKYGSYLEAATCVQDLTIVQLLIDKGADVSLALQARHGSALAAAAAAAAAAADKGDPAIIQLLIDNGADIDLVLQAEYYGSALAAATTTAAVYRGDLAIIQLLINNGADINLILQTGDYGSALAATVAAAYGGDLAIVQLLIDKGADVNPILQTGYYGSALAVAVYEGYLAIVQLLVDNGANINLMLEVGYFGSALAAAVARLSDEGQEVMDTVHLFIDKGADVNLVLHTGRGSALTTAAYHGRLRGVKTLIQAKADVNQQLNTGTFRTALSAARAKFKEEGISSYIGSHSGFHFVKDEDKKAVVELLQRHGARE